jgi:hypothetical protein
MSYQSTSECRNPIIKGWWMINGTDRYELAIKLSKSREPLSLTPGSPEYDVLGFTTQSAE